MLLKRAPTRFLRSLHSTGRCKFPKDKASRLTSPIEKLAHSEPSNPQHKTLASFLDYANRTQLDRKSTVYVGTHYEYTVQCALERLGMSLRRVGGRDDYGTDIIGTWTLPSAPTSLKILIQCKAHAAKLTPAHVRELEGAFTGAPAGWRGRGVLGLLVSQKPSSKGVRDSLGRSQWPMGFALCTTDGKIMQMVWNKRAEQEGLAGIQVGLRYTGGDASEREVILTWMGEVIH